jgi:hypothetical protein
MTSPFHDQAAGMAEIDRAGDAQLPKGYRSPKDIIYPSLDCCTDTSITIPEELSR